MFIATRAAQSAKLHRSSMDLLSFGLPGGSRVQDPHSCRASGAWPRIRGGCCHKQGAQFSWSSNLMSVFASAERETSRSTRKPGWKTVKLTGSEGAEGQRNIPDASEYPKC